MTKTKTKMKEKKKKKVLIETEMKMKMKMKMTICEKTYAMCCEPEMRKEVVLFRCRKGL